MDMAVNFHRILVTGGAGFIGSHLVDALMEKGCAVKVLDNLSTGSLANLAHVKDRITFYQGDIRDRDLLAKAAEGCQIIFHQAAVVSVPQSVKDPVESAMVNELGTLNVLEAARRQGVKRVVLASSCAVYGNDPRLPKHERLPPAPESPYAVQKLIGEQYAQLYLKLFGLETVCLRYFNVFGPRQDPSSPYSGVISIFMTKAASGASPVIYGDGKQSRDFIFVKDVVTANLLAANIDGIGGCVFNVGTGKSVSINDLWNIIGRISGCPLQPTYAARRSGDIVASVAGIDQTASVLGFRPEHDFEKGLEITCQWFKQHLPGRV